MKLSPLFAGITTTLQAHFGCTAPGLEGRGAAGVIFFVRDLDERELEDELFFQHSFRRDLVYVL
jgi:hypothetical protein